MFWKGVNIGDNEKFLELLRNKDKYKCFVDNDDVYFIKKDINKDDLENYCISFNNFGYELLNEIFQALGIDSELV